MRVIERNVQEIGKSLLITLPKQWTRDLGVSKGSRLKMIVTQEGKLLLSPEFVQKEEVKEAAITMDRFFERHFLRHYFQGNEKITIIFKKKNSDHKKRVFRFLKNFMNVQIIEENETKIVVKAFRIEELSIEECLSRMYFLSTNLIDEKSNRNSTESLQEIRISARKFYYMLVMQIRRFLAEGKFIKENQISLLRALDMRMVAQKMDKIIRIVYTMDFGIVKTKERISLFKELYATAFFSFRENNFDKAVGLFDNYQKNHAQYEKVKKNGKRSKNIAQVMQGAGLQELLSLAREISMLIR